MRLSVRACTCTGDVCRCTESDFNPRKKDTMLNNISAADVRHLTDKIADTFDACANACEAAGIGGHPSQGHAAIARRMAADIRANAALGRLPHIFHDADRLYAAAEDTPESATLPAETTRILSKLFV